MAVENFFEKLTIKEYIDANPVNLGGLFPNGKYVDMWLPMLNHSLVTPDKLLIFWLEGPNPTSANSSSLKTSCGDMAGMSSRKLRESNWQVAMELD